MEVSSLRLTLILLCLTKLVKACSSLPCRRSITLSDSTTRRVIRWAEYLPVGSPQKTRALQADLYVSIRTAASNLYSQMWGCQTDLAGARTRRLSISRTLWRGALMLSTSMSPRDASVDDAGF